MLFHVSGIMKILKRFVPLSSTVDYLVITWYILLSYLEDLVDVIPYLYIRADPGADQSTLFKIVELLACNPLHAAYTSEAALYRALDQLHGMYILDHAEFTGLGRKIFLTGFNRKSGGIIVSDRRNPRNNIIYNVYGTKLTGGTKGISDPAFRRHFIVIRLPIPDESKRTENFFLDAPPEEIKKSAAALKELLEDQTFRENFQKIYRNLGEVEKIKNRHRAIFDALLALAKMTDEESDKKIFLSLTRDFAVQQIYEREEEDSFTDPAMIILFSVWRYVEPLLKIPGFAEEKFFWAANMYRHVKEDLQRYLGELPFEFTNVKHLGKILDDYGILLGPVKRKNRRVRRAEDLAEAGKVDAHYHIHIDKLAVINESSRQSPESSEEYEKSLKKYQDTEDDDPSDRGAL
jgi:hypothetical protein